MTTVIKQSPKSNLTLAGILFFLAASVVLMGIITGEIFYPEELTYTTAKSMISDLGSTVPPNSIITQPSATIFNLTMMIAGILILVGNYFLFKFYHDKIAGILIGLLGLGILGVGIFPGNMTPMHPIFSLMTFISGGLAAIYSYRLIESPFRYIALIFGIICLCFLFTSNMFIPMLGGVGVERWVAYPVVLWLLGFGGYLLGLGSKIKHLIKYEIN
jgi:Predicted membrane protein